MITATVEVRGPVAAARRLYGEVLGGLPVDGGVAFAPAWRLALVEPENGRIGLTGLTLHVPEPDVTGDHGVAGLSVAGPLPVQSAAGGLVTALDHACLAVLDFRPALALLCDRLGGAVVTGGDSGRGLRALHVLWPGGLKVELLTPLRPGMPLARFLARRGPGLHHVTGRVADVAAAVAALGRAGIDVADTDLDHPTWQETYIRPRCAAGALIQLARTDRSPAEPLAREVVDAILAGRYSIAWNVMEPLP